VSVVSSWHQRNGGIVAKKALAKQRNGVCGGSVARIEENGSGIAQT